jgi:hypothetical protein
MTEKESLELVLWRPIFEGLSEGVKSNVATSDSGVGCFIQRASILALRAILLRHGHLFSSSQLAAILKWTILPAIQEAAENDSSPVVAITSESPLVSNIDFLVDSMPIPPGPDDDDLLKFEAQNNTLKRSLGPSELMLEASFTDLRHGGDGDIRKAHKLAKKTPSDIVKVTEQPFPDSWIATTASMALGLLTDIITEQIVLRGVEGRDSIWPTISELYKFWYLGRGPTHVLKQSSNSNAWYPCEALVRISCKEIQRLSKRLAGTNNPAVFPEKEKSIWSSLLHNFFSDLLAECLEQEEHLKVELLRLRMGNFDSIQPKSSESSPVPISDELKEMLRTPFGNGRLKNRRKSYFSAEQGARVNIVMDEIALDFGATLYRPYSLSAQNVQDDVNEIASVTKKCDETVELDGKICHHMHFVCKPGN